MYDKLCLFFGWSVPIKNKRNENIVSQQEHTMTLAQMTNHFGHGRIVCVPVTDWQGWSPY